MCNTEQRKFLKLTKFTTGKSILIPVDSIIAIEEEDIQEKDIEEEDVVKITFQFFDDIKHVFVKESIKDITTHGFVFVVL